jgi:hypothetical protein
MADLFASLSGARIVSGSIAVPLYGLWAGDVSLATEETLPDNVSFVLGNLTMHGHVYRQSLFGGQRNCRLVGGFGGWRKTVDAKQYGLSGGVQLSMVLKDAAAEVGEKVNVPADRSIGQSWVRENKPASRLLHLLAPDWYVDNAGVTQIAPWPTINVTTAFTVVAQDGAPGRVMIATEDYASWMPNCTFTAPTLDGTFTNGGVLYRFDSEGIARLEVLTS